MKNIRSLSLVTDISRPIHYTIERIRGVDTKELCSLQELFVVFEKENSRARTRLLWRRPVGYPWTLNLSPISFVLSIYKELKDVDTLDAIELRHILASSPVLQVLELGSTRLGPRMPKPEPVVLPNLNILRLLYLDEDSIRTIIDVLAPGTYNVELYIYAMSAKQTDTDAVSNTPHIFRALAHNITVLGSRSGFTTSIEAMVEKFPHTKKIRIAHSIVSDAEAFKGMLQRCSVERCIELVDISVGPSASRDGGDVSTTLCEWILTHTPNVSFLDG
ncbi:hypothetical protein RHS01_06450 [Rhizoctonia solani]|uniref:Uncharacterized protein n=1 Tax=Rhizoctonia solani TaxID=456999 RepID=A0A8H7IBS0_9AGAM|nr:hypothetical protein RHS01_06450 [Rhizoctonia solani]